jgi:glycosyltransferase involved in cell wall biosynthesis
MGLVLLEAMQAGLPIVATQVGGIPELIRHEKEGLLVPPRRPDAIAAACLRIFQNPQLGTSLRAYGNERWPQFSVASMLQATEEYYRELLSVKRRNGMSTW